MKHYIIICGACLMLLIISGSSSFFSNGKPTVLQINIKNNIDPQMNRYVKLALDEAREINVDYVIIEMDTYGGALNDADDIRTMILEYEKPIYVFINRDAASAGALISIACDSIYMAAAASIGAATVVTADGAAAPDKYQSYMRSIMRSTAEAKGRDPKIAEAMVDESLEIEGIIEEGEVLTFSTSEAIQHGFCEGQRSSVDEVLTEAGLDNYQLIEFTLGATENIIAIFLNPFISGILILVIVGGIYFELQTPGVGFPIVAAAIALVLYLTPYYLNGLAANWEILMFFVGVLLIALEIFVIPGFGLAGVTGITMSVGSLILIMLNNDVFDFSFVGADEIFKAVLTTITGLLGSFILLFLGGVRLTTSKFFKRVALEHVQDKEEGYTSTFRSESMLEKKGIAYTVLRPSGKVLIDDIIYDAYTRGNYIKKDARIIVINEEGATLQVKEDTE